MGPTRVNTCTGTFPRAWGAVGPEITGGGFALAYPSACHSLDWRGGLRLRHRGLARPHIQTRGQERLPVPVVFGRSRLSFQGLPFRGRDLLHGWQVLLQVIANALLHQPRFTVPVERLLAEKWSDMLDPLREGTVLERDGWLRRGSLQAPIRDAESRRWVPIQVWRLLGLEHWFERNGRRRASGSNDCAVPAAPSRRRRCRSSLPGRSRRSG